MEKFKYWFLGSGIVVVAVGMSCLPLGFGLSPKRDTSIFNNISDTGAFINPITVALLAVGILLIIISLFIKERSPVRDRAINDKSK